MILVPGGRKCYCGKSGCADAYCAASVLTQDNRQSLDDIYGKIESGDEKFCRHGMSIWIILLFDIKSADGI